MNDNQITFVQEDGTEELATILFTHSANDKNYIVFEFESSGELSAAIYEEDENGEGEITEIETDQEWAMLDELLDQYYMELDEEDEDDEEFED